MSHIRLVPALLLILATPAAAQFGRLGDAARRVAGAAKKPAESKPAAAEEATSKETPPPATAVPPQAAAPSPQEPTAAGFKSYSKFDFVPGEKIVAAEDFAQDAIGDFPDRWNTDASAEVVTIEGKAGRWLKLTKAGFFTPEFIRELPDNFTLEFDVTVPPTFEGRSLEITVVQLEDLKQPAQWRTAPHAFQFTALPQPAEGASTMTSRQDFDSAAASQATTPQLAATSGNPIHVSVWRQKQRVRVYINQEKVWDVPRGLAASAKLNSIFFSVPEVDSSNTYYLTNLRVATGAPDTRNKILTEGKWVSHGILFDVNSDRLWDPLESTCRHASLSIL